MMRRVVISGMGIVSPVGIGKIGFSNGLQSHGRPAEAITMFPTLNASCKHGLEIAEEFFTEFLPQKGLRSLDRNTKLALAATKMAIHDSCLNDLEIADAGVILGTEFGSLTSISGFDRQIINDGPASITPMQFQNTVINSPASQINIRYGLSGLSTTISTCQTASIDTIGYAVQFIGQGQIELAFAGGSEELSEEWFHALDRNGLLSKEKRAIPFLNRTSGIVASEGAAIFVLEELSHAQKRGAVILAEVKGYGCAFAAPGSISVDIAYCQSIEKCLAEAEITPEHIDVVYSGANGNFDTDRLESLGLHKMFDLNKTIATSVKGIVGETFGAAGGFSVAAALLGFESNRFPMLCKNIELQDSSFLIPAKQSESRNMNYALITGLGVTGNTSSIVLKKYIS